MSTLEATRGSPRPGSMRTIGLWVVLVALAAFAAFAAWREVRKAAPPLQLPAAAHAFGERRPAHSAAEERFAQALWHIHAEVRTAAVRMSFAGLAYKTGDGDRGQVAGKVAPLTEVFRRAEMALLALDGPVSMQPTRSRYVAALAFYRQASQEMIKVAQDGDDAHLLRAQEMSEQGSDILLEVGEQLWPGEIKPN